MGFSFFDFIFYNKEGFGNSKKINRKKTSTILVLVLFLNENR